MWLFSGKSGSIKAKVVVLRKGCCIRAKWLYSGKNDCNRGKIVVFGEKLLFSAKMRLYSEKSGCILEKWQ